MIKTIQLGGKEHPVRLSTGAFIIFEEKTGLEAFETLKDHALLRKPKNIAALVYGSIKMGYLFNEEECPITFEQVGNFMDVRILDKYLLEALQALRIEEIEEVEGEKKSLRKVS